MHTRIRSRRPLLHLRQVDANDDLGHLVLAHEALTGHSGRLFVIIGADRLPYQVHSLPGGGQLGLRVDRLDPNGRTVHSQCLTRAALSSHALVAAQAAGQLFTPLLRCCS